MHPYLKSLWYNPLLKPHTDLKFMILEKAIVSLPKYGCISQQPDCNCKSHHWAGYVVPCTSGLTGLELDHAVFCAIHADALMISTT